MDLTSRQKIHNKGRDDELRVFYVGATRAKKTISNRAYNRGSV